MKEPSFFFLLGPFVGFCICLSFQDGEVTHIEEQCIVVELLTTGFFFGEWK